MSEPRPPADPPAPPRPSRPDDASRVAELFAPRYRAMVVGLVLTITLVAIEALAIGTVMPAVADDLEGLELYGWVFSAFFLGNLLGIVVAGGALDRMPLVRPFAAGLLLFATGILVGGLAPSMEVLVAARFIQGLGAGVVPPSAYVAIGRTLPERLRPRMFAILSTAWVVPGVIGPSIAAVVGGTVGWRWVFLGLLPFLVVAGGLAISALRSVPDAAPDDPEHAAARESVRRLPNAILVTLGAGVLVAALTSPDLRIAVGGAAVGLALLLPAFRRLTPRGTLVLAAGLPAAVLLRGLLTLAFFAPDAYVPVLLQDWRGDTIALTGLAYTAATLSWTAASWFQARRLERVGARRFVAAGFAIVALGCALTMPVLLAAVPAWLSIVTWGITGIGMGLAYSAFAVIVLRDAAPAEQGAASSALQLSDTLGTALGTGVAGAIVAAGERAEGDALGVALAVVFAAGTGIALFGVVASGRLVGRRG